MAVRLVFVHPCAGNSFRFLTYTPFPLTFQYHTSSVALTVLLQAIFLENVIPLTGRQVHAESRQLPVQVGHHSS